MNGSTQSRKGVWVVLQASATSGGHSAPRLATGQCGWFWSNIIACSVKLLLAAARSDLVDVDFPKVVMDMQLTRAGYTAVLGATSRVPNTQSLATFLR
jgi:hypothetical protein